MTALHLDLHAHLGCRRNLSAYAHTLVQLCHEESEDVRAMGWCPRLAGFHPQLALLIVYKQPQRTVQFWDVLVCNFWMFPKLSGMDVNCVKEPHHQGRGLEDDQPQSIIMQRQCSQIHS